MFALHERQGDTELVHPLTDSPTAHTLRSGLGEGQEPGIQSRFPHLDDRDPGWTFAESWVKKQSQALNLGHPL